MSNTNPVYVIGRALLGYTADNSNEQLDIRAQHDILKQAALHQVIAAKVAIERFYPDQHKAVMLANGYIESKSRKFIGG